MEEIYHVLELSALLSLSNSIQLIKSRYQTMQQLITRGSLMHQYDGITDCLKTVTTQEGIKGLFKGNSISLLRFFPFQSLSYRIKNASQSLMPKASYSNVISGICGGLFASIVFYPIDTARIFILTSQKVLSKSIADLTKNVQFQGSRYLYRGFKSCLLSIVIFRGIFYGFYDTFKSYTNNIYQKFITAYTSGLLAGFTMYPLETLRKRNILCKDKIQDYKLFRAIVKNQGFLALFRGCSLTPLQSLLASAVLLYFDEQNK